MGNIKVRTIDLKRAFLEYGRKVYRLDTSIEKFKSEGDGKYISTVANHFIHRLHEDIANGRADFLLPDEGKTITYARLRPFLEALKNGKANVTFKNDVRTALVRLITQDSAMSWERYITSLNDRLASKFNTNNNLFNTSWDLYYFVRDTRTSPHLHSYYLAKTVVNFLEPIYGSFTEPSECEIELSHAGDLYAGRLKTHRLEDPNLCQIEANPIRFARPNQKGNKLVINFISHVQTSTKYCEGIMLSMHSASNCILGNFVLFTKNKERKRNLNYEAFHHKSKEYDSKVPSEIRHYFSNVSKNRFYSSSSGIIGTKNRLERWATERNRTHNASFQYDMFISAPYSSLHHKHISNLQSSVKGYDIDEGKRRFMLLQRMIQQFQKDIKNLFGDRRNVNVYSHREKDNVGTYNDIEKLFSSTHDEHVPSNKESHYYAQSFDLCKATICFLPFNAETDAYLEAAWSLKEQKPTIVFYGENVSLPSYLRPKDNWIREHYLPLKIKIDTPAFKLIDENMKVILYRFIAIKVYKFSDNELISFLGSRQQDFLNKIPSYKA